MKIKYSILSLILIFIFSCKEDLDINRDPDLLSPDQVPLSAEFPSATSGVAAASGSYYAIIGGLWSQFYTQSALANQYKNIDDYSIGTNDYGGAWNAMYDALLDADNVRINAENAGNWNYLLMSTCIKSYGFQLLTDMYGPVPYSQALSNQNLNPAYDDESVIYDSMAASIKYALSKDLSTSDLTEIPSNDDLIFGGDMSMWTKFANTMLLKLYLRQTNSRPSVAQAGIQELYSTGAQFLTSDAAITAYIDEANRSNPLYETNIRQLNVGTNLRTSTTLYSFLTDNSDTRRDAYYTAGASQDQGDFNNPSGGSVGVAIMNATDPVYFFSTAESYFLQAEADARYNGSANAKTLYDLGVMAAFGQFGLDGSSFIASGGVYEFPNSGSLDDKLKAIITQKWISFFPGKGWESFIEQNRTKIPAYSPVPATNVSYVSGEWTYSVNGTTGSGNFPKRVVYPQREDQTNTSFPGLQSITTPVWYNANP